MLFMTVSASADKKPVDPVKKAKKTLSSVSDDLKKGKNLANHEKTLYALLGDSVNRSNEKIYLAIYTAQRKQYEQINEKLYLKQKTDTAELFNMCRKMFLTLETLDSIDARADKNGQQKLKYRDSHSQYLNGLRKNLYAGGAYFIRNQKYDKAFEMYDTYINTSEQPLFSKYDYPSADAEKLRKAAYWASYSGYKAKDADMTLKYKDLAVGDTVNVDYVRQYIANAYYLKNDTANSLKTLNEGFDHNPCFPFFFPRLIDYYTATGQMTEALDIVNRAIACDSTSQLYLSVKSSILLNLGLYDETIALSDDIIARNDSLAEPYFNAGSAYANKAAEMEKMSTSMSKVKKNVKNTYSKARTYMEKYRALMPEQKKKWAPVLYRIYLNLNLGKQFSEIENVMKQLK